MQQEADTTGSSHACSAGASSVLADADALHLAYLGLMGDDRLHDAAARASLDIAAIRRRALECGVRLVVLCGSFVRRAPPVRTAMWISSANLGHRASGTSAWRAQPPSLWTCTRSSNSGPTRARTSSSPARRSMKPSRASSGRRARTPSRTCCVFGRPRKGWALLGEPRGRLPGRLVERCGETPEEDPNSGGPRCQSAPL